MFPYGRLPAMGMPQYQPQGGFMPYGRSTANYDQPYPPGQGPGDFKQQFLGAQGPIAMQNGSPVPNFKPLAGAGAPGMAVPPRYGTNPTGEMTLQGAAVAPKYGTSPGGGMSLQGAQSPAPVSPAGQNWIQSSPPQHPAPVSPIGQNWIQMGGQPNMANPRNWSAPQPVASPGLNWQPQPGTYGLPSATAPRGPAGPSGPQLPNNMQTPIAGNPMDTGFGSNPNLVDPRYAFSSGGQLNNTNPAALMAANQGRYGAPTATIRNEPGSWHSPGGGGNHLEQYMAAGGGSAGIPVGSYGGGGGAGAYGNPLQAFLDAQAAANAANQARYNDILGGYGAGRQFASDTLSGLGAQDVQDTNTAFNNNRSAITQQMLDSGLNNSTIVGNMQTGNETQRSNALARVQGDIAQRRLGTELPLLQQQLQFMASKNENGPDAAMLANLMQAYGAGGGGSAGGGGQFVDMGGADYGYGGGMSGGGMPWYWGNGMGNGSQLAKGNKKFGNTPFEYTATPSSGELPMGGAGFLGPTGGPLSAFGDVSQNLPFPGLSPGASSGGPLTSWLPFPSVPSGLPLSTRLPFPGLRYGGNSSNGGSAVFSPY